MVRDRGRFEIVHRMEVACHPLMSYIWGRVLPWDVKMSRNSESAACDHRGKSPMTPLATKDCKRLQGTL